MTKMAVEGVKSSAMSSAVSYKKVKAKSTKNSLSVKKSTYTSKKFLSTDPKVIAKQQQERNEFLIVTKTIQNNLKKKVCY